ncbi:MmcQ/YjbR family DNA-binding protein [Actinomadura adrarensis]|uniref:MmcQ/YjbR family DNA-binding protein n=1 Tax=Actinomadura adrarensis TaxID=1819600 RepID=A0ABW3CK12_9ACTN
MDGDDVRTHCLSLPATGEEYPFGPQAAVYKVAGKMFALLAEDVDPQRVSLKLPPDEVEALKAQYEGTVLPGYHLNKRHWVTVLLDGVLDDGEVLGLIEESYDLVVAGLPKRLRPVAPRGS